MTRRSSRRLPGIWRGVRWAFDRRSAGGGTSRLRLGWRALQATLSEPKALQRWMAMVFELYSREVLHDLPGEYLRAVRPYVHSGTGFSERVVQLVDHMDWLETAFHPAAFSQIAFGQPMVLAELTPPRGYEFMRLQLRHAGPTSAEGEMLLTLTLQRSAELQHKPKPIDAAVLAFSRFRIEGTPCFVIGGVRGQRHPVQRVSPVEIASALQGWKPAVFLVRVSQELARYWNLRLVGLDPAAHRLHGWSYRVSSRNRDAGERVFASYRALWDHFDAANGPAGWVVLPHSSDEKLAATALSPEKRARQARRADFWLRTRGLLRAEMRKLLQRPGREVKLERITQQLTPSGNMPLDEFDSEEALSSIDDDFFPSKVLQTAPGILEDDA
jgi:uncharacterized protein VirK/YbjX